MKWRVVLEPNPETGDWAVWCPELPGCTSAGITEEGSLDNIREAIKLYLQPDTLDLNPGSVIRFGECGMTRLRRMNAETVERKEILIRNIFDV